MPKQWAAPRVVFVNSMSDLFHARVPDDFVRRVFDVMAETPRHTYQVLTKRRRRLARLAGTLAWPENVWMGVSVEDTAQAWRADKLREVPAAVRFISAEPLLGSLDTLDLDHLGLTSRADEAPQEGAAQGRPALDRGSGRPRRRRARAVPRARDPLRWNGAAAGRSVRPHRGPGGLPPALTGGRPPAHRPGCGPSRGSGHRRRRRACAQCR